ncbi:MAG: AbrB/MazE/SpoVT family DNA-binding domain-containing protein [Spirochaetes bacterium]|nr:AbrB/MazE/SpoVT family DNA-binding domain-containing protein [Spirochaetota bacterium]
MGERAKIFINGRSQAVRLPREFRFEGDEVKISREGKRVVLEPVERKQWPKGFWKIFREDRGFETPAPLPGKSLDLD